MDKIQIIHTLSSEELMVMPRAEYEALVAAADLADEDAEDLALYDSRKAEFASGRDSALPEAVSAMLLRGNSRLKALRLWRGFSQTELAAKAGIGQGYLSDIETGRRAGSEEVLQTIAQFLDVPVEWISA